MGLGRLASCGSASTVFARRKTGMLAQDCALVRDAWRLLDCFLRALV